MANKIAKGKWDIILLMSILIMLFIGIIMIYSASYFIMSYENNNPNQLIIKEIVFVSGGLFTMWVASRIHYSKIREWAIPINILAMFLYGLLLTPLGKSFKGGLRWIYITRTTTFMPSEVGKYAGIIALAYVLSAKKSERGTWGYRYLSFCPLFYLVATVIQPDLSTTIVMAVSFVAVLFFAGLNPIYVFASGAIGIFSVIGLIFAKEYRMERIQVFLDPFIDPLDKGYQAIQSLYAVALGGIRGSGLGNGKQKMLYLPLSYNDYIFSIYAEEMGFVGCIILITVLSVLVFRGLKVGSNAPDRFSTLVVGGIISQIAIQSIMNMYVSVNLVPSTGIPFPIISYGGTSLVVTLIALGFVLGVSRLENQQKPKAFKNVENKNYYSLER